MHQFRPGKSTHISMISNSVTHLRSYTNTAIADITLNFEPISPESPREFRACHTKRQCRHAEHRVFEYFMMLHNVSCCFTSSSWGFTMYHNVLGCITMFYSVSWCFTMFSESHNDRHRRCHRDRRYRHESDPMLNSVLNGDWSNSVPGRQIPKSRAMQQQYGL